MAGTIADLHFAPTEAAAAALRREDVTPGSIHVTGNTVIDALLQMREKLAANPALAAPLDPLLSRFAGKRIIAVTTHRRESFGEGMAEIAAALKVIAARGDVGIIYPLHPNSRGRRDHAAGAGKRRCDRTHRSARLSLFRATA